MSEYGIFYLRSLVLWTCSLDTVCFLVFASDHLQSNIAFLFIKPLQNDLWIIRAQKKALNSKDEPVLFLHFTGNLAKNQF